MSDNHVEQEGTVMAHAGALVPCTGQGRGVAGAQSAAAVAGPGGGV